jgi:hypothetical protein
LRLFNLVRAAMHACTKAEARYEKSIAIRYGKSAVRYEKCQDWKEAWAA